MPSGVKMGAGLSVVCNGKWALKELKQIPIYRGDFIFWVKSPLTNVLLIYFLTLFSSGKIYHAVISNNQTFIISTSQKSGRYLPDFFFYYIITAWLNSLNAR